VVVITSREFRRNPFSILMTRKKYIWHGTDDGTEAVTDKARTWCLRCSICCGSI